MTQPAPPCSPPPSHPKWKMTNAMSYCTNCGTPSGPGRFCVSCGSPLSPTDRIDAAGASTGPHVTPAQTPTPGPQPPPDPSDSPTRAANPSKPTPAANPFAGIPMSDYVRDILAAALLLISLALPWDFRHDATGRIDVVLITVLSVLSLLLPYLSRVGVFPSQWNMERLRVARLLANAPYVLLVLIYLLIDLVSGFSTTVGGGAGLGAAAWLGLAGALLAAQPREAEMTDPRASRHVGLWFAVMVVCGALLAITLLVTLVRILISASDLGLGNGKYVAYWAVLLLAQAGVVGFPLIGTIRRSGGWRLVLIPVGLISVISMVFRLSSQGDGAVESVDLPNYTGTVFWIAAATAAASPAVRLAMYGQPAAQRWIAGARHALDQEAVVAAMMAAAVVAGLTLSGVPAKGAVIFKLVAVAVSAVLAVLARQAVARQPVQGRGMALAVASIIAVLGLINVVVSATASTTDSDPGAVVGVADLLLLGLPVVTAIYLTAPPAIREFYAGTPLFTPGQWQNSSVAREDPAQSFPFAPQNHGSRTSESLAADPSTPMRILADLAYREPALRPLVAANPAAYPDLLVWLGKLKDPMVEAALASRQR